MDKEAIDSLIEKNKKQIYNHSFYVIACIIVGLFLDSYFKVDMYFQYLSIVAMFLLVLSKLLDVENRLFDLHKEILIIKDIVYHGKK